MANIAKNVVINPEGLAKILNQELKQYQICIEMMEIYRDKAVDLRIGVYKDGIPVVTQAFSFIEPKDTITIADIDNMFTLKLT